MSVHTEHVEDIKALRNDIFNLKEARWRMEYKVNVMQEAYRLRRQRDRRRKMSVAELRAEGKLRAAAGGYIFCKTWKGGRR